MNNFDHVNVVLRETGRLASVPVVRDQNMCEHAESMCRDCIDTWLIDYKLVGDLSGTPAWVVDAGLPHAEEE